MAIVNCSTHDNELRTKADAPSQREMGASKSRMISKMAGGMFALSLIAAMQPAYGSEPATSSRAATAPQATPAMSSAKATKNSSGIGVGSLASEAEKAPEIVWEPIGKYSQKEIDLASDTIGQLFSHMKKMEAIETSVAPLLRGEDKKADKEATLRAAKSYSADAEEESKLIARFEIPALKNRQAADMIAKAKAALKSASEIQKVRASKVIKMVSGKAHSKAQSDEIQELGQQRIRAAFQFVNAYMAYESYGFTSDQIDLTTGRLKKNAKPDRL